MKIKHLRNKIRFHPYPRKKLIKRIKSQSRCLRATLFPFQEACLYSLEQQIVETKQTKFIIISALGSGKTLVSCTFMQRHNWNGLFLTPDAVYDHIQDQFKQHFTKRIKVNTHCLTSPEKYHVTLLSFSQFTRLDLDHALFHHWFQTVVVDEIATIAHKKAFLTHLKKLKSVYWLGLTGVPIKLAIPKLPHFQNQCFVYENANVKLSLPEHRLISHEMTQELKNQYNQIIDNEQGHTTSNAVFLHLRKLLSLHRVPFLINHIEQLPRPCKIVIFSEFNETLFALQMKLKAPKIDSSTSKSIRFQLLSDFAKKEHSILLCSRSIVGIGNDLGFVDVLVVSEPAYNKEDDEQLIGRITRLGQSPLHYSKQIVLQFLFLSSCEDKLYQCKQHLST